MALEQEIKFIVSDFSLIRQKLQAIAIRPVKKVFEVNHIFDTPERSLRQKGVLMRLRQDDVVLLTLKRDSADFSSDQFKTREETETIVGSFSDTQAILEVLGYICVLQYEKFRESWIVNGCLVCLDILPFGFFVEIEGVPEAIQECIKVLALDIDRGITKSYYILNEEYRHNHGLPKSESFVFSPKRRHELLGSIQTTGKP